MQVEWDRGKDRANRVKHDLGFDEVRALFESDTDYLVIFDAEHSTVEDRFLAIGPVAKGVVVITFSEPRDDVVRIISARRATRAEQEAFYRRAGGRKR